MAPSTDTAVTQVYYTLSGYPDTFTNTANMLTNDITDASGGQPVAASGAGPIRMPAEAAFPARPMRASRRTPASRIP